MDDWLVRLSLAETTARGKLAPFRNQYRTRRFQFRNLDTEFKGRNPNLGLKGSNGEVRPDDR